MLTVGSLLATNLPGGSFSLTSCFFDVVFRLPAFLELQLSYLLTIN